MLEVVLPSEELMIGTEQRTTSHVVNLYSGWEISNAHDCSRGMRNANGGTLSARAGRPSLPQHMALQNRRSLHRAIQLGFWNIKPLSCCRLQGLLRSY